MAYRLHASAGDLALVIHDDYSIYRYNLGNASTDIVTYQLADHEGAFEPGKAGQWTFHNDAVFETFEALLVWWRYDRTGH